MASTRPAEPRSRTAARPAVSPAIAEHQVLRTSTLVTSALLVLGAVALVFLLAKVLGLVMLILVAIVFAEGIRPLVTRVEALRVPQALAIVLVYVALLLVLTVLITLLVEPVVTQASNLATHFPDYQQSAQNWIQGVETRFRLNTNLGSQLANQLNTVKDVLIQVGAYIVSAVVNFILVLVIGFLWLMTSGRLSAFCVDLLPRRHQPLAREVFAEIAYRMGGYLRATAINMVLVGGATGAACALLRLPSPLLLGIFAGLSAAVPLVGPFVGLVPPLLLALTVSPKIAIFTLIVLLVIQLVDGNTVIPVLMNRVLQLPALAVVLALLIGGALEGFLGALLAVPVAAAMQVIVLRVLVPYIHAVQARSEGTSV